MHKRSVTIVRQGQVVAPGVILCLRILLILFIFMWLGLFSSQTVHAQEADTILVQPPDLTGFPTPSFQIKLPKISSQPSLDLEMMAFSVFEDDKPVQIQSLTEDYQGVYFTLAVNGGREMDLRDQDGISPYQKLSAMLIDWAASRSFAGEDAWSLVTHDGVSIRNKAVYDDWVAALSDYQPNFRTMEPTTASLESAIQFVRDRVVPFGVDKVLLYITPPPTPNQIDLINTLSTEARLAGICVNVWMVGDGYYLSNDQGGALLNLSESTGGQFFHYTGVEDIPDPEAYLSPLGRIYTLTYESIIQATGTYSLAVRVEWPGGEIRGESAPFYIAVQPPRPILISPPTAITRQVIPVEEGNSTGFTPDRMNINIMIQFPDGYIREIVTSRLFVDGRIVDQKAEAPFDTLTWDLSSLNVPAEYAIQVEVIDSLGLSARTILTPVQIDIIQPEPEPHISNTQIGIIISGTLLSLALILLSVWLARRYSIFTRLRERMSSVWKDRGSEGMVVGETVNLRHAKLIPIECIKPDGEDDLLQITGSKTTLGSAPNQVDIFLDKPDVEGLHACFHLRDDHYWINDMGSRSGTWVNNTDVGIEPVQIKPGDLIYFGNFGFRFTIIDKKAPVNLTVTKYEPIL